MKIAIVGSRKFGDLYRVANLVDHLKEQHYKEGQHDSLIIISGGAKGVDTAATTAAAARGIGIVEFLPDPKVKPFVKAAMDRNSKIVESADWVYAFYSVKRDSTGTIDVMYKALMAEKLVGIFTPKGAFQNTRLTGPA